MVLEVRLAKDSLQFLSEATLPFNVAQYFPSLNEGHHEEETPFNLKGVLQFYDERVFYLSQDVSFVFYLCFVLLLVFLLSPVWESDALQSV